MSAIKSYYFDEICAMESDPRADYPNPEEEQWWSEQDKDDQWIKEQSDDKCIPEE